MQCKKHTAQQGIQQGEICQSFFAYGSGVSADYCGDRFETVPSNPSRNGPFRPGGEAGIDGANRQPSMPTVLFGASMHVGAVGVMVIEGKLSQFKYESVEGVKSQAER
jgi:hypothetical protein